MEAIMVMPKAEESTKKSMEYLHNQLITGSTYAGVRIYIKSVSITGGISTADDGFYKNAVIEKIDTDKYNSNKPTTFKQELEEEEFKKDIPLNNKIDSKRRDSLRTVANGEQKVEVEPLPITSQKRREVIVSFFVFTREDSEAKSILMGSLTSGVIGKLKVPKVGVIDVRPKTWKMTESDAALGITNFEITFIEDTDREKEIVFAGRVKREFNKFTNTLFGLLSKKDGDELNNWLIRAITWWNKRETKKLPLNYLSEIYLSAYNTLASIPTLFKVLQDLGFNRTYKAYLHLLGIVFSLDKLLDDSNNKDKKQIENIVLADLDEAISYVDNSNLINSIQTVKASYLMEASKLPEARYKTKNIKRNTSWLAVCKDIYGNINNEKQLQQINKNNNINPLFFKGKISYNAVAN